MEFIFKFSDNESIIAIYKLVKDEGLINKEELSHQDILLLEKVSNPRRRLEIISSRIALKSLGVNQEISYHKNGKPCLKDGFISISHTDNLVAIHYNEHKNCGIDIEELSPRLLRITKRAFSSYEIEMANNEIEILSLMWCTKECIFKIVDEVGVDFKSQILIDKICQDKIYCKFISNAKLESSYTLQFKVIDNHALVWGQE
jgi:4'-phosphopantetheinyl transferase